MEISGQQSISVAWITSYSNYSLFLIFVFSVFFIHLLSSSDDCTVARNMHLHKSYLIHGSECDWTWWLAFYSSWNGLMPEIRFCFLSGPGFGVDVVLLHSLFKLIFALWQRTAAESFASSEFTVVWCGLTISVEVNVLGIYLGLILQKYYTSLCMLM